MEETKRESEKFVLARMSCVEEKRAAGRRKKNNNNSSSGGGGGGVSAAVPRENWSPILAGESPSLEHGKQRGMGTGTGPDWAGEQPSLTAHHPAQDCCLLCHHERKDWGTQPNGIADLKTLAHAVPTLAHTLLEHMPLWICQTCQRRVEEEEQRSILEQTLMIGQSECQAHKREAPGESTRAVTEGDGVSGYHRSPTEKCHHSAIHCCHQMHRHSLGPSNPHPHQLQLLPCTATSNDTYTKESSRASSDCSRLPSCVSIKASPVQCKNMSRRPTLPGGELHCSEDHRYSVLAAPPNSPTGMTSNPLLPTQKSPSQITNEPVTSIHQHQYGHVTATSLCSVPHSTASTNSNRRQPVTAGLPHVLPHVSKTSTTVTSTSVSSDMSMSKAAAALPGGLVTPVLPGASSPAPSCLSPFPNNAVAAPGCTSHYNGACSIVATPSSAAPSNGICRDQSCKTHLCTNEASYTLAQAHNAEESLEEDDSCSEHSSCTSHSANQKEGKYCDCCYCEFFGHGPPPAAPTSRNYTEIREKLRTRLTKRKEELPQKLNHGSIREPPVDERNVEDLLHFINSSEPKPANSAKAAKRARHKQKKQEKARSEACDQRPEKPCPSRLHIQDIEKVSLLNQHIQGDIEEKVLIFNQHIQEDIEEKVSKLNQHIQDDIEETLNQQELWHQVKLQQVSSILTSRLEQLKDRIRDSIKANFSLCDLPLDKNDFPEIFSVEKDLLYDSNGSMDKEELAIIDHQKRNLNLSMMTQGTVQNHLLNGNRHTFTPIQEHNELPIFETQSGRKSNKNCLLLSKAADHSKLLLEDTSAFRLQVPSAESRVKQQIVRSGKQAKQPKQHTSEDNMGKPAVLRKDHEQTVAPKAEGSKQHTCSSFTKQKSNQAHDSKSPESQARSATDKCADPRPGKWKGVYSEAAENRKGNIKNPSYAKVEVSDTRGVQGEQHGPDSSQPRGKNQKNKKKKNDKPNTSVMMRTDEAGGQGGARISSATQRPKHSDDVFLPKDLDLESVEMDETDREVEHFKR
uniref:FAM193 C-terminal domain-containing protein n=2 Tax=Callorhinchus milii TaxID=7868 RepID=A0A4W3GNH4_CALMI